MLGWIALALLLVSLACSDQRNMRQIGIVSALCFLVQYRADTVLLITQCLIIALHAKWLYCNK